MLSQCTFKRVHFLSILNLRAVNHSWNIFIIKMFILFIYKMENKWLHCIKSCGHTLYVWSVFEYFFKYSHLDKAQLVQLLCTLTADQKDYTNVCSMTDSLVFKYGTMIVYCIKHRTKYYMYVSPFGILSTQKTDLAKVAVVLFMFLIY